MFRKILIVAIFGATAGYCFAAQTVPEVVTSEVFYTEDKAIDANKNSRPSTEEYRERPQASEEVPAWPVAGSDADVTVLCDEDALSKFGQDDNVRIVSKVGNDLVVKNNFNLGVSGDEWSGGADLLYGSQIPVGFDDECTNGSEMPLLTREMLEDDGGSVLAVSRSSRKNCNPYTDEYNAFAAKMGMDQSEYIGEESVDEETSDEGFEEEISVDVSADMKPATRLVDEVRSWVVADGETLREILQDWCNKEGWDLVWATSREYPIEASAVFRGRFIDVASALVRNFSRATPIPYAKFYKGNRVLVVSTSEE